MTPDAIKAKIATNRCRIEANAHSIKLLADDNANMEREIKGLRYTLEVMGEPQCIWKTPVGLLLKRRGR
jgi:hypothetical protein